jgi:hypothetical protein
MGNPRQQEAQWDIHQRRVTGAKNGCRHCGIGGGKAPIVSHFLARRRESDSCAEANTQNNPECKR